METIPTPRTPVTCSVRGRLVPGKCIKIFGAIPSNGYLFNINFISKPNTEICEDIALRISFNLLDKNVVLNSMQKGKWDEAQTILGIPIRNEQSFEILIMCYFTQYEILINGEDYCNFPQKIPCTKVTDLCIEGDIVLNCVMYPSQSEQPLSPLNDLKKPELPLPPYSDIQSNVPLNYGSIAPPHYTTGTQFVPTYQFQEAHPMQPLLHTTPNNFHSNRSAKQRRIALCCVVGLIIIAIVFISTVHENSYYHHHHHHGYDHNWNN